MTTTNIALSTRPLLHGRTRTTPRPVGSLMGEARHQRLTLTRPGQTTPPLSLPHHQTRLLAEGQGQQASRRGRRPSCSSVCRTLLVLGLSCSFSKDTLSMRPTTFASILVGPSSCDNTLSRRQQPQIQQPHCQKSLTACPTPPTLSSAASTGTDGQQSRRHARYA